MTTKNLIKKVQLRQDIIRGDRVLPETVCLPGEGCIERPEFYQMYNGVMMGSGLMNMKITISRDRVDCGMRKSVEEIILDKYKDYEVFTFGQVVHLLREKLE